MRIRQRSTVSVAAVILGASLALGGCGESVSEDIEDMEGGSDPGVEEDVGEELPEG